MGALSRQHSTAESCGPRTRSLPRTRPGGQGRETRGRVSWGTPGSGRARARAGPHGSGRGLGLVTDGGLCYLICVTTTCYCRVCGASFQARRSDALTCSSTCRQRLRRGGGYAYLDRLSPDEQWIWYKYHETQDALIASSKEARAARQIVREAATRKREEAAAAERERVLAEFLGRQVLAKLRAEELKRQQKTDGVVVACVEWFTKEGREISPEAIANFLNQPEYSRDIVAAALARLHA